MTETELLEALVAELKEYGEVFIPDEDIVDYPGSTWQELQRAMANAMGGEELICIYEIQKSGFIIRRVSPSKQPRRPRPIPDDDPFLRMMNDAARDAAFKMDEWQRIWLKNYHKGRGGQ